MDKIVGENDDNFQESTMLLSILFDYYFMYVVYI